MDARILAFALAAAGALASASACSSKSGPIFDDPKGTGGAAGAGGAGAGGNGDAPFVPTHTWNECQASDQAWVKRAIHAVQGRRPVGQVEVQAYLDVLRGVRKAELDKAGKYGGIGNVDPPFGGDLDKAKRAVADALLQEDAYLVRWSDFFMDALRVVRIETKAQTDCYGTPGTTPPDGGELAAWVRDNPATATTPPGGGFSMGKLLASALVLDDISPVYRAHLFAMLDLPFNAANVAPNELELARRHDFGAIFEAAYIHRDLVCLSCHNSEFSVTFHEDPAKNHHWPTPGLFEVALYGRSDGKHPGEEMKGEDVVRARSMLRVMGVTSGAVRPYGWVQACGDFTAPSAIGNDPLGVDTYFGSLRGTKASVWDLEASLRRGIDLLAQHGLRRLEGGALADADEAFAYLVAQNVVERVWTEVMGSRLTIANYFPRTQVQRDILMSLTEHFIASHFSVKTLLRAILAHPAFNLKAPEEGCGVVPYELPPIFDPWTITDDDLSRRPNSPGDGVFAVSARPLRRQLERAMEWPAHQAYPSASEETFQIAIGFFIKDAEPGFRGLDFQGRLTWEQKYGRCAKPAGTDVIDKIAQRAGEVPGATVGDAVVALKDRLVGEPSIDPAGEQAEIEALVGASLDAPAGSVDLSAVLRSVCGVLVSSPQFMLGGLPSRDAAEAPKLTPSDVTYATICAGIAGQLAKTPYTVTCTEPATVSVK